MIQYFAFKTIRLLFYWLFFFIFPHQIVLIRRVEHGDGGHQASRTGNTSPMTPYTSFLTSATISTYFFSTSNSQPYHLHDDLCSYRSLGSHLQCLILHQLSQHPLLFPSLLYLAVCGCSGAVSGEVVRLVPVELESPAWHRVRWVGRAGAARNEEWTGPA